MKSINTLLQEEEQQVERYNSYNLLHSYCIEDSPEKIMISAAMQTLKQNIIEIRKEIYDEFRTILPTQITKEQAQEFWRDLQGTLKGKLEGYKENSMKMRTDTIAHYMEIQPYKAEEFMWRCANIDLELTEYKDGWWII